MPVSCDKATRPKSKPVKELEEIAAAYQRLEVPCALATVVRVEGSSYRQAGARMLVSADGKIVAGCVSGGCLEADVAEHGQQVIATGEPRVLVYDTLNDVDAEGDLLLGLGTGCAGIIEILVEQLIGENPDAIALPLRLSRSNESGSFLTVYRRDDKPHAEHMIVHLDHMNQTHENGVDAFLETIQPPPHLLLCGGGPDSLPLARLAREILGWRVTIADHRAAYADVARYGEGVQIAHARPDTLERHVRIDARTAVILMTHNYLLDRELLDLAARSDAFYVGVLGSRKRWHTLDNDLRGEGTDTRALLGTRLHAPVGLDIGASSPETIALSIAAEVQAALASHAGGAMRDANYAKDAKKSGIDSAAAYTTATPARMGRKGDTPRCRIPLLSD